jgi:hypothetical protein
MSLEGAPVLGVRPLLMAEEFIKVRHVKESIK